MKLEQAIKTGDAAAITAAKQALDAANAEVEKARKKRDEAKTKAKNASTKEFNENIRYAKMANADFDDKNPGYEKFQKLFADGPVKGTYKIFAEAINDVVKLVKMFFFYLYEKSMTALLPFIMTMSFAFSFVRYLFQNVRNR